MPSAFEELQNRMRESIDIKLLASKVANVLRRFEKEEKPVIYDEEADHRHHPNTQIGPPKEEELLRRLGFLHEFFQNNNPYDYQMMILNEKAHEMYERLKREGYYSEATISKPAE